MAFSNFQAEDVLGPLAGAGMVSIAAWLLALNPRSALHRTFGAFLVFQGLVSFGPLYDATPGVADPLERVIPLAQLATLFTVPLFLYNFQQCHCIAHVHGPDWVRPVMNTFYLVAPWILAGLFLLRSSLYAPSLDRAYVADLSNPVGPLFALNGLELVAFAWIGFVFANELEGAVTPVHRRSYVVVALGFSLAAVFGGSLRIVQVALHGVGGLDWPYLLSAAWAAGAVLVVLLTTVTIQRRAPGPEQRRDAQAFLGAVGAALASGVVLYPLARISPETAMRLTAVFHGAWSLALPLLVTYAILKHRFFDIDVRIRRGVKQGTVAAAFVATFFIVSEGAQTLLEHRWGPVFGLAGSGLLVFALAPLQRVADKVANAAVPAAQAVSQLSPPDKLTFYREQVHIAWGDGQLNQKERLLLDNLRQRLGLSAEDALSVERQAVNESWAHKKEAAASGASP